MLLTLYLLTIKGTMMLMKCLIPAAFSVCYYRMENDKHITPEWADTNRFHPLDLSEHFLQPLNSSQLEYENPENKMAWKQTSQSSLGLGLGLDECVSFRSSSFCLFLPSSVVPGVCRTPAGSRAWQDDAGGLSASSTLTLHPIWPLISSSKPH